MTTKHLTSPFALKDADPASGLFQGHASVFDVRDLGGEVVERGAFADTLKSWSARAPAMPPVLWQHRSAEPIGVFSKLQEDDRGLYVEGRLLIKDDPLAARAFAHLKAGSVRGLSIGYDVPEGGAAYDKASDTLHLRTIELWEASIVTFPMNQAAQVEGVKSLLDLRPQDFERWLRDVAGLSRTQAKALMACGWSGLLREAGDETGFVSAVESLIKVIKV